LTEAISLAIDVKSWNYHNINVALKTLTLW